MTFGLLKRLTAGLALSAALVFGDSTSALAATDLPPLAARLDAMLTEGRIAEARALLRESVGNREAAAFHVAHFEGVVLMRQGRHAEAVDIFRQILAIAPAFTPSRVELARALYMSGQSEAASFHFDAINLGAGDLALRRLAQAYLDRIASEKPYGIGGHFGFVPSTNVNRGTTNTTFDSSIGTGTIGEESRRKGDLGFAGGINGYRNFRFGENSGISVAGTADVKKFLLGATFDEASVSSTVSVTHEIGRATFRVGPTGEYILYAWAPYLLRYGLSAGAAFRVGERTAATVSAVLLRQDFAADQNFRDGWVASGSTTLRHMLSPSLGVAATLGLTLERTAARADLDHSDGSIMLRGDKEWSGGLMTSGFVKYEHRAYAGDFPTTTMRRQDDRVSVGGRIAHRRLNWMGFAPQLTYEFTRQFSNIGFFDYQAHDLGITFTRNF